MPLILIELPDDAKTDNSFSIERVARGHYELKLYVERPEEYGAIALGEDRVSVTVDPSVYVVPSELSDLSSVFAHEEDAEAYSNACASEHIMPRGVFRLLICDSKVTAEMVADRAEEDDDVDWSGVHWNHDEGAPIECSDDEDGERFAHDDMITALYVAANGWPWLLYEEGNAADGQRLPWQISAFKTKESALGHNGLDGVEYPSGTYAFVFDGRLGIDQIRTNGAIGYRPRRGADVTIKEETEGI